MGSPACFGHNSTNYGSGDLHTCTKLCTYGPTCSVERCKTAKATREAWAEAEDEADELARVSKKFSERRSYPGMNGLATP